MFVYLAMSEMQYLIYRPDLSNSQTSRKKLKKQQMVKNKLPINFQTKNISKTWLMLKFPNISKIQGF